MHPLANLDSCQLVVIDMQTKLGTAMPVEAMTAVVKQTQIMLQAAQMLAMPTLFTEQYPQGLGHTLPELAAIISPATVIEKRLFQLAPNPNSMPNLAVINRKWCY